MFYTLEELRRRAQREFIIRDHSMLDARAARDAGDVKHAATLVRFARIANRYGVSYTAEHIARTQKILARQRAAERGALAFETFPLVRGDGRVVRCTVPE